MMTEGKEYILAIPHEFHCAFHMGHPKEEQGKTYQEIQDMWYRPDYWEGVRNQAGEIDELIEAFNKEVGIL